MIKDKGYSHDKEGTVPVRHRTRFTIRLALLVLLLACIIVWACREVLFLNKQMILGETPASPTTTQFADNAVAPVIGETVIFKTPTGDFGAVRFESLTRYRGAKVSSWFLPAAHVGDRAFSVSRRTTAVQNLCWLTRGPNGELYERVIGGKQSVMCGPYQIAWSETTWLYFPDGYSVALATGDVGMAGMTNSALVWKTLPLGLGRPCARLWEPRGGSQGSRLDK